MTPASKENGPAQFEYFAPEVGVVPVASLSVGERRMDAEAYLAPGFSLQTAVQSAFPNAKSLGQLARVWQPSRLKGVQVAREWGIPFLAATQAFDVWPTPRKFLAPRRTPDLKDRYVAPGWILVTCSGSVGDPIMSYAAHENLIVSHDLMRIQCDDALLTGYVYAFLRTSYGRAILELSNYGNIIKHLETQHFEALPVPIINGLVDEIGEETLFVYRLRDEAYRLDMRARERLERALEGPADTSGDTFVVRASALDVGRRRLDASVYNPTASAIVERYRLNATEVTPLGTVARAYLPNRFKRIFGSVGVPYLDSEPIFKINPGITKVLTAATEIDPAMYEVKAGWLLLARSGQTYGLNGQAILATRWHEGKVVTEHIMRLVPNTAKVRAGYLEVVLTHPTLGQPLVISRAHGTSVPELDPKDIESLPIPRLGRDLEDEIADMAERASELRMQADEKENGAIARLEAELERRTGVPAKKPSKIRPDADRVDSDDNRSGGTSARRSKR